MTDKNSIFKMIRASRARRKIDFRLAEVFFGLNEAKLYLEHLQSEQEVALRYIPITLYTCLETWTRMVIRDLIDYGSPYLENAGKLVQGKNIDFEILVKIDKKTFTLGDVVSRMQREISVDSIFGIMSDLLGINFRNKFASIQDRISIKIEGSPETPIIDNIDETLKYVSQVINLRHIFSHEIASAEKLERDNMEKCVVHTELFLKAAEHVVQNHQFPIASITPEELSLEANTRRNEARDRLEQMKVEIPKNLTAKQLQHFSEANNAWEKYLSESIEIESLEFEGDTMQSMLVAGAERLYIEVRIRQLMELHDLVGA